MGLSYLRWDRAGTLYIMRPVLGGTGWGCRGLPVLMYHGVTVDNEAGVKPYYRLSTSPARFAEQMQWLDEEGYVGLSLPQALRLPANARVDERRPVAITFDDGFRDFAIQAWPALQERGFNASMYLPTGYIARTRKRFCGKDCLTWPEVRKLRAEGAHFGSHTVQHPKLHHLSWPGIEQELRDSREQMQQELQEEITSFAYPYAFPQEDDGFTARLVDLLVEIGYRHCATTMIGFVAPGSRSFCLRRLPMNSADDRALFTAKLNGFYNWLGPMQGCFRKLKKRASHLQSLTSALAGNSEKNPVL